MREWLKHDHNAGFAESIQDFVDVLIKLNKDTPKFWEYR